MKQKPVRVHTAEVELTQCPVCGEQIEGALTVEVHLGDLNVSSTSPEGSDKVLFRVDVPSSWRMRNLRITHDCKPDDVEAYRAEFVGPDQ